MPLFRSIQVPPGFNDEDDDSSAPFLMDVAERTAKGIVLPPQEISGIPPGLPALRHLPVYKIRLHAIRTANDDGSQAATITAANIETLVKQANAVYFTAGIEFQFDPATDFETKNNTLLNHDFTLVMDPAQFTSQNQNPPDTAIDSEPNIAARENEAQKHKGKIVVFFRYGDKWVWDETLGHWKVSPVTGGSSSWAGTYVNMTRGMPEINLLAHECGHYLHNRHPFVGGVNTVADAASRIKQYVEGDGHPISEGLNALDGDRVFVLDTPADTAGTIFDNEGLDICGTVDHIDIPVNFANGQSMTYTLKPNRRLIMSYFKHCTNFDHHLSQHQILRTRDGLENGNKHHLITRRASDLVGQLEQRGEASAGVVSEIAVARTAHRQFVTALRDSDGNLKVIAWEVSADGQAVVRKGDASAGAASKITACSLGLGIVATAVRDSENNLKIILWQVSAGGNVVRKGEATAGVVSQIAACRLGIEYLSTAVRDGAGDLLVIVWHVTADGQIRRWGDASAGAISQVAVNSVGNYGVATSVRDGDGNLKVIIWEALPNGHGVTRRGEASAGDVSAITGCQLDLDLLATAVRDNAGNLKVITWQVTEDGQIVRKGDAGAGFINEIAACRLGLDLLVTPVLDSSGNVKIILWEVKPNGTQVIRRADASAGAASKIAVCCIGVDSLATVVRYDTGNLKLIVWTAT